MKKLLALLIGRSDFIEPLVWLQRCETWHADYETNYLRLVGLSLFTVLEFVNYSILHDVDHTFHVGAMMILVLWWAAAGLVHGMLARHYFPHLLGFLISTVDLLMLTAFILILGHGPRSPRQ